MSNQSSEMVLHTRSAKRLISGRKGDRESNCHPVYGLQLFAKLNSVIWADASRDNPYAIWFLSRFDDKQKAVQNCLNSRIKIAQGRWKDSGLSYQEPDQENDAQSFSLLLKTPYSWKSARQIKQFDNYLQEARQLNNFGLLSDKEMYSSEREVNRMILACFNESTHYLSMPMTWENRLIGTQDAALAVAKMGELPSDILDGHKVPDYLPKNH